MLKRTDIFDNEMLNDLRVLAEFDCRNWNCDGCPFNTGTLGTGCASLNAERLIDYYDTGKEVIY